MKIESYIYKLIIISSFFICSSNIFASEITSSDITEAINTSSVVSIDESVLFEEDEYVRIARPIVTDESLITTFESKINMMGEAREGTLIAITVYQDENVLNMYDLEPVGATQTFNQLIELGDRHNVIIVSYMHEADGVGSHIQLEIYRQPDENKALLKNFIISTTSDLPDRLVEKADSIEQEITMMLEIN
ncbi:MAG: hypothetical protein ATN35_03085 [Epulopiscium sp. Nele67-Bin004]|nr:MAG: hypothetical protein ATN35_03085 [Epulopiscium sp. Nele67-Bin004]